ncbi:hypothetical protein APT59_14360 [Pseudomonas oryzihabitans]|uniref:Uncharacterized protein n=1 Tax=Pseudomonas oryzihabitans TaxID=47885 RepID=A0A0U4VQJ6_9PSED|nr:hypothetical protein APT59_14360 [Pseudomonas oryzihabitans]
MIGFLFHYGIAFATQLFELLTVEYRDVAAAVFDNALALQFARGLGDPFATYAEHVGDQFRGHVQLIARQTIQR